SSVLEPYDEFYASFVNAVYHWDTEADVSGPSPEVRRNSRGAIMLMIEPSEEEKTSRSFSNSLRIETWDSKEAHCSMGAVRPLLWRSFVTDRSHGFQAVEKVFKALKAELLRISKFEKPPKNWHEVRVPEFAQSFWQEIQEQFRK